MIADAARNYIAREWSVVPLPPGRKDPKILDWTKRVFGPDDFAKEGNIGVKLGEPSGGLVDVDLDGSAAYALAGKFLPATDATFGHGQRPASHWLYVCRDKPGKTRRWNEAGVELRATGGQTMFPPSTHPNGEQVAWSAPGAPALIDRANLEAACERLAAAALAATPTEKTETPEPTEAPENMTSAYSDYSGVSAYSVEQIISETMPTREGQRNECLFRLSRGLKFDAGMDNATCPELKRIVRRWHDQAFAVIGTAAFDETWADFLRAWGTARVPLHADLVGQSFRKAQAELPLQAGDYDSEPARLLVGLCFHLGAQHPQGRFFLSCHQAGAMLGIAHDRALRLLAMLCADGVLELVERGNARRATRYRWAAGRGPMP